MCAPKRMSWCNLYSVGELSRAIEGRYRDLASGLLFRPGGTSALWDLQRRTRGRYDGQGFTHDAHLSPPFTCLLSFTFTCFFAFTKPLNLQKDLKRLHQPPSRTSFQCDLPSSATNSTSRLPATATMAACGKVLNTYELFEHIITFLPPRQILTVERVSKTWKAVIEDSARIAHTRNIASSRMLPHFDGTEYPIYAIGTDLRINPLVHERLSYIFYRELKRGEPILLKDHTLDVESPNPITCKKAVRDSFLTSPPVRVLNVVATFDDRNGGRDSFCVKLESPTGLRVRDLELLKAEATNRVGVFGAWRRVRAVCLEELEKPK